MSDIVLLQVYLIYYIWGEFTRGNERVTVHSNVSLVSDLHKKRFYAHIRDYPNSLRSNSG